MSPSPQNRGSWLSQNYDKLVLVIVLLALLLSVLFLFLMINNVRRVLAEAKWDRPGAEPRAVTPLDLTRVENLRRSLAAPFQAEPRAARMFSSDLRVSCVACGKPIPFDAIKCSFCAADQPVPEDPKKIDSDRDGIPDFYEQKLGLNPLDPTDAGLDADGDGFSNLEEHQAETSIADAADFPSPVAKLRVGRMGSNPFKLRFQGEAEMPDGSIRYQLNLRTLERTYFAKIDDELEGYKVLEYVAPTNNEPASLLLKQGDTRVRLVKGKEVTKFEVMADLVFLIDRTRMRVRVGDEISLKERKYKVVDIRRDGVLIRDVETGRETLVGLLSDAELNELRGGTGSPASSSPAFPAATSPAM